MDHKSRWNSKNDKDWVIFTENQLNKLPLNAKTKAFLEIGFPSDAAPFLSFGSIIEKSGMITIAEFFKGMDIVNESKDYYVFGSDGSGNIICIDSQMNDRVVLLDHEQDFKLIEKINIDVAELYECLVEYRSFIRLMDSEFGEDAFYDFPFTKEDLDGFKSKMKSINALILDESDFWKAEVYYLLSEIEE